MNQTPFYAESGGQIGDTGTVAWVGGRAHVTDTVKTLYDKNETANIFYVNDSKENAFFHSVFSDTDRFSFGFNVII